MRKIVIYTLFVYTIIGCSSSSKEAEMFYQNALLSCKNGSYSKAKLQIDSIRTLFPKEYEVIKKAIILMREVENKEQSRTSIYCDSIINSLSKQASELEKEFVFEKRSEYENIGKWVLHSQQIEKKIRRSYLRCSVDEKGQMILTSVYYGSSPIHYNALKVSTGNDIYAQTLPVVADGANNYSFVDNGMTSQIISFSKKNENGITEFIRLYPYKKIKVDYLGGKPYSIVLDEETKKAIVKTRELSDILKNLIIYKNEKRLADAKLIYLAKKKLKIK